MNARTHAARRVLAARQRAHRAASRIRRTGRGTAAAHALACGLAPSQASTVAQALRRNASKQGCEGLAGVSYRKGRKVACTRYTRAEMARAARVYRPRTEAYRAARELLIRFA